MFDQRKYYKKNRRKLLGRQKRRNEARKTDIKSYMERYYKKNRDDILAHQKLYYDKNHDKRLPFIDINNFGRKKHRSKIIVKKID